MNRGKIKMILATSAVLGITFVGLKIVAAITKKNRYFAEEPKQQNPLAGKKVVFVEDENDLENADGVKGHLEAIGESEYRGGCYDRYIKRGMDVVLSFFGLIFLAPVIAGIAIAIKIDDPGPVFFTQKRLGQNKKYFKLYKFRSMKMCTPHDVPTHMLENPEQYITKVGKFIRAHSLDELPQIFNVFAGDMSLVGPRPGLWNQDVLTAERDKYGANDVKPGITGWAQINGRDAIEIPEKAALDGEYVKKESLLFDLKCLLGTVSKVGHDDSVVEGGTGEMKRVYRNYTDGKSDKELIGHIGFGKTVEIEKEGKKRILITGAGSYIGESFKQYASDNYAQNFEIDEIDMLSEKWREADFSAYDIVYHVAGIAHADVGNVSEETKQKYYAVNTDLAIDVAKKAKEEGVKEFILMSSMIVYGDSAPYGKKKVIDENTVPTPANFYGNSKLQADVAVRELADESFKVIVLRPPMIYGKGSKGNYPTLAKFAKKLPVFPDVENERSMLYIENLCEFLCQIMLIRKLEKDAIVLIPQNAEWTKTVDMVKEIAKVSGKNVAKVKLLKPAVAVAGKLPGKIGGLVNKAFGNSCYAHEMSRYDGIEYQKKNFLESIGETEAKKKDVNKRVLILVNHNVVIYNFRKELVAKLFEEGYEVYLSCPQGDRIPELQRMGCKFVETVIDRHGKNIFDEVKLLIFYLETMKAVRPEVVLTYTIKPNIYGGIASSMLGIRYIENITGLGVAIENGGKTERITRILYRIALKRAQIVFFQNESNKEYFVKYKLFNGKCDVLPGSGVNLEENCYEEYPESDERITLLVIGRLMKDKGTDEILEAAKIINEKYNNVTIKMLGFYDDDYEEKVIAAEKNGYIEYLSQQDNVHGFIKNSHATVLASYHEGMSNVLLESAATGRPVIASDIPGCRETFDDGKSGIAIQPRNVHSLVDGIVKFINLPYEQKKVMGKNGRQKMEEMFSRSIVVDRYMREISDNKR